MQDSRQQLKKWITDPYVLAQADAFLNLLQIQVEGSLFDETSLHRIQKALNFAAWKHRHQTRKNQSKTPYIIHPIGVARQLIEIGKVCDPDILIAALLHDTVEDTDTSLEEIQEIFGTRVAGLVAEVSDDKALPKARRKELQIENAPAKTLGASQIKLADALCNLLDLTQEPPTDWSQIRKQKYCDWAETVIDHLPHANPFLKEKVHEAIALFRQSNQ